uniref:Uncharacterized protein n=1 Tax=Babesia bovis TaxID=5865 RepID=A7AX57_BABBO|eukprot:XP_001608698.1 hypothetical protein [Babesia bovis T2Bo]
MSPSPLSELVNSSYRVVTNLLTKGKRSVPTDSVSAFIQRLEKSLPNHFWDLQSNHVAVLLFAAARSSKRNIPAIRSLCARLHNICDDADRSKGGYPNSKGHFNIDLETLVVIAWSLSRISQENRNKQIKTMAHKLSQYLLDWVDGSSTKLESGTLVTTLPPDDYAKLCTAFVCLHDVIGRCKAANEDTSDPEPSTMQMEDTSLDRVSSDSHDIYTIFNNFVTSVLKSCRIDTQDNGTSYLELYIGPSIDVITVLMQHGNDVTLPLEYFNRLMESLDISTIRGAALLTQAFSILMSQVKPAPGYSIVAGGFNPETGIDTQKLILDEIGTRDLGTLTTDQLISFLSTCSRNSIQHLRALDALADAFLQRSHNLPPVPQTVEVLSHLAAISYHNGPLLELFVRHVQNNLDTATPEQLNTVIQCCVS